MDARQQLIDGRRLSRLRQDDLPDVAKAIAGFERGIVRAERIFSRGVAYYRFSARGFDVLVLATDYEVILPLVQNGTFDPRQYPHPRVYPASVELRPSVRTIDQWDPAFYSHVYTQLLALFPDKYPTSNV